MRKIVLHGKCRNHSFHSDAVTQHRHSAAEQSGEVNGSRLLPASVDHALLACPFDRLARIFDFPFILRRCGAPASNRHPSSSEKRRGAVRASSTVFRRAKIRPSQQYGSRRAMASLNFPVTHSRGTLLAPPAQEHPRDASPHPGHGIPQSFGRHSQRSARGLGPWR